MSKYIELADRIRQDVSGGQPIEYLPSILKWLDAHPDQVPGRTYTESEFRKLYLGVPPYKDYLSYAKALTTALGITVVPDPEPTPRQRLEAMIFEKWGDADDAQMITMSILEEFDVSVKAQGGDDE